MIIVDVETTGLDPRSCSIVSIGAIVFENSNDTFYGECRIWDGAQIEDDALLVNGFSREEITNPEKHSLNELIYNFADWAGPYNDKVMGGQNPSFDTSFLDRSFERANIENPFRYRTVDLHSVCFAKLLHQCRDIGKDMPKTPLKLDEILRIVGLPPEPMPHNALTGAKLVAEAFSRLIFSQSLLEQYKNIPTHFNL